MFTTNIKLFDRSISTVIFTLKIDKAFKTAKLADKYLYKLASEMTVDNKNLWLVGSVYNADGKIEYNIGLL